MAKVTVTINEMVCKGCGLCTWVCPVNAIDRVPELDFEDGVPFQDALFLLPHVERLYAD